MIDIAQSDELFGNCSGCIAQVEFSLSKLLF